jgi:hypothetical protein
MVRFGQPVLDAVFPAAHIEHMGGVTRGWAIGIPWRERELNAVIGENGVDFVGDRFNEGCQEGRRGHPVCFFSELSEGEFAGPVDGHEEEELSLRGLDLGDVDVEEADRVWLERFLCAPLPGGGGCLEKTWREELRRHDGNHKLAKATSDKTRAGRENWGRLGRPSYPRLSFRTQ